MPRRRPRQAVGRFLAPIREAVTCVIPREVYLGIRGGYQPEANPQSLIINDGRPMLLGNGGIYLALHQTYDIIRVEGRWKVSTRSYIYSVRDAEDVKSEIVAFHFHPESVPFCHAHTRRLERYGKAHFPTGRVPIEEVIALIVREFGVTPARSDHKDVLQRGFEKFAAWRTWHTCGTVGL